MSMPLQYTDLVEGTTGVFYSPAKSRICAETSACPRQALGERTNTAFWCPVKEIPVSGGKYAALVDDEDYDRLAQYHWHYNNGYAFRNDGPRHGRVTIRMHREILDAPEGTVVDHINHNRLDNRRSNLRFASFSENTANARLGSRNTSGYKGVSWASGRWYAQIQANGVWHNLGRFVRAIDAAYAYDAAAREKFGQFAETNFSALPADYQPASSLIYRCMCRICGHTWDSWHPRRTLCSAACRAEAHRRHQADYKRRKQNRC